MAILTLRPNAAGVVTTISYQYPAEGYHWDKVDEETADDLSTYLASCAVGSYEYDLFNIPSPGVSSGVINSIKLYMRCRIGSGTGKCAAVINDGGTNFDFGSENTVNSTSWTDFSETYTTNPWTSSAWTWANLTNLQIGVMLGYHSTGTDYVFCTQVWLVVDYIAASGSQVRVIGMMM